MKTIKAVLQSMTFQNFQAIAERADRERAANERLAMWRKTEAAKRQAEAQREQDELRKIGRPEYQTLAGAKLKHALDMEYQTIRAELYGNTLYLAWQNRKKLTYQPTLFEGVTS